MACRDLLISLHFVFGENADQLEVEFWRSSKDFRSPQFSKDGTVTNWPILRSRLSLIVPFRRTEYCPLNFDLEWYSQLMKANPAFVGKVVIDALEKRLSFAGSETPQETRGVGC